MEHTIRWADKALCEHDIAAAEVRMNRRIPPDYRAFLLRHNTAIPERTEFSLRRPDGSEETLSIASFLGIDTDYGYTIEWYVREYSGRIPAELLPIAIDPGGNVICLATSGKSMHALFFWDHEFEPAPEEQPAYDNITFIAQSLADFVQMLR